MPNVTVYIRKEDLPKWKALKGKSEAISNMLNSNSMHNEQPIPSTSLEGMFKGDILDEIKALEKERDDKLEYCQDQETATGLHDEYGYKIGKLWEEYRRLDNV